MPVYKFAKSITNDDWCWLICWLMLTDRDLCLLILIDSDWSWLILIDANSYWLMLIDADWCWLMLIDADWCWLMLIDADWCQLMLIDAIWCSNKVQPGFCLSFWNSSQWTGSDFLDRIVKGLYFWNIILATLSVFVCRSVPPELLRSFFGFDSSETSLSFLNLFKPFFDMSKLRHL